MTALLLTMIMLTVGLAGLAQVDVQQEQSGLERVGETAFNLGEGTLGAQIFPLSQRWPGPGAVGAGLDFSSPCTEASPSSSKCPSKATIAELFTSPDVESLTSWRTEVRDNKGAELNTCTSTEASPTSFYSDEFTAGQPGYDSNADCRLWVRAQATVRGRTRAMVALVQAERVTHQLPRAALLAGRLEIEPKGKDGIIDARAAVNTGILLRCATPTSDSLCAGHKGKLAELWSPGNPHLQDQLNGTKPQIGYDEPAALTEEALSDLEQAAIANGTWYPSCPADADVEKLAGEIVWVETCNTVYSGRASINTSAKPGALIIENGPIEFGGNIDFYGLLYHANAEPSSSAMLVKLAGNGGVTGAVFVEGQGGVFIQDQAAYITVDSRAFDAPRSYGSAGIIQNTWREIPPGP